jgi:hypothetical protein
LGLEVRGERRQLSGLALLGLNVVGLGVVEVLLALGKSLVLSLLLLELLLRAGLLFNVGTHQVPRSHQVPRTHPRGRGAGEAVQTSLHLQLLQTQRGGRREGKER